MPCGRNCMSNSTHPKIETMCLALLILKEKPYVYLHVVLTCVLHNVFKGESVTRGVFVSVRRGVSLEALRRKLFVITFII